MTPKQRRFAEEYSLDHSGAEAAIRAGYSVRRARQTAYELLRRPDVSAYVSELDGKKRTELGVSAEWIVNELKMIAEDRVSSTSPARIRALEVLAKLTGLFSQRPDRLEDKKVVFTYRVGNESRSEPVYKLHLDRDLGDVAD